MTSTLRYLSKEDVAAVMPPPAEVVDLVEDALRRRGEGRAQMPPKVDLAPGGDAFLHAMPALVGDADGRAIGMKWVSGYPDNGKRGLPYVSGVIVLNDPETGLPVAVMDATEVTAARTGACTAVTARHLADPNSEVISILGCGVQGRANLEALLAVFPETERMLCYDTSTEAQNKFADEMMTKHNLASIIPPEPRECTEGAHIIVTSGPIQKSPSPVIDLDWIQTGTLCVALDFDSYFMPSVFEGAELFVTDDLDQFRYYRQAGHFEGIREPSTDLPAIVTGQAGGRPDGEPRVIAANLGLGLLDVALGAEILRRAAAASRGAELPL